jgi:N-acetyl-gamma-glutamyl-phosphate reductase
MGLELVGARSALVTFTPHLVPMQRGLLATVTAPWVAPVTQDEVRQVLADHYAGRRVVEVIDRPPQTRWTVGSNRALVTAFVDERQGLVITQCALDNLLKGASGQAVQVANLIVGLEETVGLPLSGWLP